MDTICDVIQRLYLPEVGTPDEILMDKGGQFGSHRWKNFGRSNGFATRHTSPYNPQSNPVERVMKEINRVLRAYDHGRHTRWDAIIPRLKKIINITKHRSTGAKPIELLEDLHYEEDLDERLIPR